MFKTTRIIAALALTTLSSGVMAEKAAEEMLIATVNGVKITTEDINLYMSSQPASTRPKSLNAAVEELINRELLRQEAVKQKLGESAEFKKDLEAQKTNLLVNTLLSKEVENVDLSDKALKKEYDEQLSGADLSEYKARHILVKEEKEAEAIIAELKKDADFEKLAKEKSTGPSGKTGGDLGWFPASTMVPEFAAALKEMKKGKFSDKPVKTQFGWHVILLEDQRKIEVPSFEQSKSRIKQVVASKAVQKYINGLVEKGDVELHNAEKK